MSADPGKACRLARIIKLKGLSQRAFAREIGYSGQAINQVLRGKQGLSTECALKVAQRFGVRIEWLIDGLEPMWSWESDGTTTTLGPPESGAPILKCPRCYWELSLGESPCPRCLLEIDWPEPENGASGT